MEAKKQHEIGSLDVFCGLIKFSMTAYFLYHFVGWMYL